MKTHQLKLLVPALFAVLALTLAVGVSAQAAPAAPATAIAPAAAKSPQAVPATGHPHMDSEAVAKHEADMKAECQAMMARKKEMHDKVAAMDATLDKLVAEMNAAKASKDPDALEKPMAAVLNELVVQRKAMHSLMMETQPKMMEHMMRHGHMQGMKGGMDCPTMKSGAAPEAKADEAKPKT